MDPLSPDLPFCLHFLVISYIRCCHTNSIAPPLHPLPRTPQDWRQDTWSKRFVRDNLRYGDSIQCAAARVVDAVRRRARERRRGADDDARGEYDSFHVRRGDLVKQYRNTNNTAEEIYRNSRDELTRGGTVYVATDERDRGFFEPLSRDYDVVYLDDFREELAGIDARYFGMIDQLVASRGRVFFGKYLVDSTMTIHKCCI